MSLFKLMPVILLLPFFVGCVSTPTQEEQLIAYYGDAPESPNTVIKGYLNGVLKDPMSAMIEVEKSPRRMWVGGGLMGPVHYGWGICAIVNAKNSFGGYVGPKRHFFLIQDNKVLRMESTEIYTNKLCW